MGCSCSSDKAEAVPVVPPDPDVFAYGYKLNDLEVVQDTVQRGDTFADIFLENGFSYTDIYNINSKVKKRITSEKSSPKDPILFYFRKIRCLLPWRLFINLPSWTMWW